MQVFDSKQTFIDLLESKLSFLRVVILRDICKITLFSVRNNLAATSRTNYVVVASRLFGKGSSAATLSRCCLVWPALCHPAIHLAAIALKFYAWKGFVCSPIIVLRKLRSQVADLFYSSDNQWTAKL